MEYKDIFELILDENDFTVGGGASSAIAGAMACGLISMVANLSKGKNYGYSDEEYNSLISDLKEKKAQLLEGSIEDREAYILIVDSYKLPKATDEEKMERAEAVNNAGIQAANVPLKNAQINREVYQIGLSLLDKSNPNCITDLEAGISFSKIGIEIGISNVEINLNIIKNEQKINEFKESISILK